MEEQPHKISDSLEILTTKLEHWGERIILNLPNFILAVLVILFFLLIAKYAYRLSKKIMRDRNIQKSIQSTLSLLIRVVFICIGLFVTLGVLNLGRALVSVLAGAGIASFAVGFALQGILKNIISGFILSLKSQINIKDWIKTKEYEGEIFRINLRNIVTKQSDNNRVVIPNAQIVESPFKNFPLTPRSRVVIQSRVGLYKELNKVEKLITDAMASVFPQK